VKKIVLFVIVALLLAGCGDYSSSTSQEANTVESQDLIYLRGQPIPIYDYSPERDIFIQLYNFRMKNVPTWTVICSNLGNCIDYCPSLGYPLPADVQLTNPLKSEDAWSHGGSWSPVVVEQREPNGLFSSKNTAGTWVMCVYEEGRVEPVYTELNATAYAHPVKIVDGMVVHNFDAPPSAVLDTTKLDTNDNKPIQYQTEPVTTEVPAP